MVGGIFLGKFVGMLGNGDCWACGDGGSDDGVAGDPGEDGIGDGVVACVFMYIGTPPLLYINPACGVWTIFCGKENCIWPTC